MAFQHGKSTSVLMNQYDLSGYFRASDIGRTVDMHDSTCYGSSAKAYVPGLRDGTLSLEGLWDSTADPLVQAMLGTASGQVVTLAPAGLTIGNRVSMLSSRKTTYTQSAPVADLVSVAVDAQADGGIDAGVSLHALSAETAGADYTSVDNGAASSNGYSAHLHATAVDAVGAVWKVQHSTDNNTFADLVTFATATTAGGATSERVTGTGAVNRYVRANLSGTLTSITAAVAFARR